MAPSGGATPLGLTRLEQVTKTINEGRSYMKRFLVILVASMFLGSAAYAAQEDRKVGFTGEQKTPDEENKSDVKSGTVKKSQGSKEDRKVGFTGEQKTSAEKTKSGVKSGTVTESQGSKEDRKVGFTGEQKTPDQK